MLNWRTPTAEDVELLKKYTYEAGMISSDSSPVNIYLLREKYNIKIAEAEGFLFRKYTGEAIAGRSGIAYPMGKGDIGRAIELASADRAEKGQQLKLIYLTKDQCESVKRAGYDPEFFTDRGNSDYLYTAEHLWELAGRDNHKKKNRAKRFERLYPDCIVRYQSEYDEKFCRDILYVEEMWFMGQEERPDSAFLERQEIYEACATWNELGLTGAVVYTPDNLPVAMSIASGISEGYFDVHFEKCFGEYAQAGGFAYINRSFAGHLISDHDARWINREEDIGLEGLRRAKMSYNPDLLLDKYHCIIK